MGRVVSRQLRPMLFTYPTTQPVDDAALPLLWELSKEVAPDPESKQQISLPTRKLVHGYELFERSVSSQTERDTIVCAQVDPATCDPALFAASLLLLVVGSCSGGFPSQPPEQRVHASRSAVPHRPSPPAQRSAFRPKSGWRVPRCRITSSVAVVGCGLPVAIRPATTQAHPLGRPTPPHANVGSKL